MAIFHDLSTAQLRQALQLREQIELLQQKLNALLGGADSIDKAKKGGRARGKRKMSAEARANMAAAQQARRAKLRAVSVKAPVKMVAKKKSGMTPEAKAKIAAAMKARWAAKKSNAAAD